MNAASAVGRASGGGVVMGSWLLAPTDLLDGPAVAVGVLEGEEGFVVPAVRSQSGLLALGAEVERLADLHATLDQFGVRRLDVVHDQVRALVAARRRGGQPGPDGDRARRAGWCQLHHPERVAGPVVDVL